MLRELFCFSKPTHGRFFVLLLLEYFTTVEKADVFKMGTPETEHVMDEMAFLEALEHALGSQMTDQAKLAHVLRLARDRVEQVRRLQGIEEKRISASSQREHETIRIDTLVGCSVAMSEVYDSIRRVCQTDATVLLRGESGTGKELVAKAIHRASPRVKHPFVTLHCAAITETLFESALFGHEPGAFTGAIGLRKGRFEQADGGTLFLDELGDIPLATQVKLLRVLQDQRFERVGGTRPVSVDVRLIGATHRDLEGMLIRGRFREDLYYRLNVVPITLPPLRDRESDIPLLIHHFLSRFNRRHKRSVALSNDLRTVMCNYRWPGNVRELQNCVERLVVMADRNSLTLDSLPTSMRDYFADLKRVAGESPIRLPPQGEQGRSLGDNLQDIERRQLRDALERAGWVQARAARTLGLTPRQVAYKVRKYQLHACQ